MVHSFRYTSGWNDEWYGTLRFTSGRHDERYGTFGYTSVGKHAIRYPGSQ